MRKSRKINRTLNPSRSVRIDRIADSIGVPDEDILTVRDLRVLALLILGISRGNQYTVRELNREMGWRSPNASLQAIDRLVRLGFVKKNEDGITARALVPTCRIEMF